MRERPILFAAPMVRAVLADVKTQTRRALKPAGRYRLDLAAPADGGPSRCPYGKSGELLWVREAWDFIPEGDPGTPNCAGIRYWADGGYELRSPPSDFNPMLYGKERVRPSIHMPRWASRITLEIIGVRVERLQDISEADAIAEGIQRWPLGFRVDVSGAPKHESRTFERAQAAYRWLWQSINGAGSWDLNPWVWVLQFKRLPTSSLKG